MKSSLPAPTKAEKRRFDIIKREIGFIACYVSGYPGTPADAHHLLDTGRRISHAATIPLCKHHHEFIHRHKHDFRVLYGTDKGLLKKTNRLVADFETCTV